MEGFSGGHPTPLPGIGVQLTGVDAGSWGVAAQAGGAPATANAAVRARAASTVRSGAITPSLSKWSATLRESWTAGSFATRGNDHFEVNFVRRVREQNADISRCDNAPWRRETMPYFGQPVLISPLPPKCLLGKGHLVQS